MSFRIRCILVLGVIVTVTALPTWGQPGPSKIDTIRPPAEAATPSRSPTSRDGSPITKTVTLFFREPPDTLLDVLLPILPETALGLLDHLLYPFWNPEATEAEVPEVPARQNPLRAIRSEVSLELDVTTDRTGKVIAKSSKASGSTGCQETDWFIPLPLPLSFAQLHLDTLWKITPSSPVIEWPAPFTGDRYTIQSKARIDREITQSIEGTLWIGAWPLSIITFRQSQHIKGFGTLEVTLGLREDSYRTTADICGIVVDVVGPKNSSRKSQERILGCKEGYDYEARWRRGR